MDPCRRCIRMEEQIVRAFVNHFPTVEYTDAEQALAMLLGGVARANVTTQQPFPQGTYVGNYADAEGNILHGKHPWAESDSLGKAPAACVPEEKDKA